MKLLDLFCGAGGAAVGYHRAGFTEIVGVDNRPMPRYPFRFVLADALEYVREHGREFDAIHASPPCQAYSVYGNNRGHVRDDHPDLIAATRNALQQAGRPYVIENVPGAPLITPIKVCGTSFGLEVRRHRLFEASFWAFDAPCRHYAFWQRKYPGSTNRPNGRTVCNVGEYRVPFAVQCRAVEIDWMRFEELSQAIPPAYTEFIGRQLLQALGAREAGG